MQSIIRQVQTLFERLRSGGQSRQVLYRTAGADAVADPCMKRIMQLADGRPIAEVVESLYLEAVQSGAAVADIGMWQGIFYREMAEKIRALADQGYLMIIDQALPERRHLDGDVSLSQGRRVPR